MKDKGAGTSNLTITYSPVERIELTSFTKSLEALTSEHSRYLKREIPKIDRELSKIYIDSIKEGSIIIDLLTQAGDFSIFDDADKINHLIEFGKYMKDLASFFLKKTPEIPQNTTSADAVNIAHLIEPIAKNPGSTFNMVASSGGKNEVHFHLPYPDARRVYNNALNWAGMQRTPKIGVEQDMLFYWYQARDASGGRPGDKGIIEAISPDPVITRFANDNVKETMLSEALFQKAYLVNVQVQTIEGKPTLYRILDVVERFDRE